MKLYSIFGLFADKLIYFRRYFRVAVTFGGHYFRDLIGGQKINVTFG